MTAVLDKLISGCVSQKNMKLVADLLANEKFHYVELSNPAEIKDKLWDLGNGIQQRYLLEFTYQRQDTSKQAVSRIKQCFFIGSTDTTKRKFVVECEDKFQFHK